MRVLIDFNTNWNSQARDRLQSHLLLRSVTVNAVDLRRRSEPEQDSGRGRRRKNAMVRD